jgi:hypothetical protein
MGTSMTDRTQCFLSLVVALSIPSIGWSQPVRGGGNPYSSQLVTDPDAGTIQGIQQYGRPMAADPAQGNGYPFFVYPSVRDLSQNSPFQGTPTVPLTPQQQLFQSRQLQAIQNRSSELETFKKRLTVPHDAPDNETHNQQTLYKPTTFCLD